MGHFCFLGWWSWLEDDLQSELRVEGFARTDARGAVVVADGLGDRAEGCAVAEIVVGRSVVGTVEEVEHLDTELRVDAAVEECEFVVLEDGEVDCTVGGGDELVAAHGAEGRGGGFYEGAGGDPLNLSIDDVLAGALVGVDVGNQVDAVFAFTGSAGVVAGVDGVGLAAVEAKERVELPAVGERLDVGTAGDVVSDIAGEGVTGVVIHVAVVALYAV